MTTPDDLRARLLAAADECAKDAPLLREAIAALSALPAAGGGCGDHDHANYIPGCPKCALTLPEKHTTPQPSAAVLEDGGPPCSTHPDAPHGFNRNASHTEDRYVCDCEGWKPDAAVGAQGDGVHGHRTMDDFPVSTSIPVADLAAQLRQYADPNCRECDGSGVWMGNVLVCSCILDNIPAAPAAGKEEISPEFTDSARAAIAWVLYHHQGGNSAIGQPLRFALGMGNHEPLPEWRIAEAKAWAEVCGETENFRRIAALTRQPVAGDGMATCKGPLQISEATGRVDLFETARKVARLGEHGSDGDESYDELASEIDQEILAAAYEREEVDREVRGSRIFYFRHNPPNTWLAQIFNSILLANGTYEVDRAKHAAREEAARSQLGVLAAAPAATPTDGGEG